MNKLEGGMFLMWFWEGFRLVLGMFVNGFWMLFGNGLGVGAGIVLRRFWASFGWA